MTGNPVRPRGESAHASHPDPAQPATGAPAQLEIRRHEDEHGVILALAGELDLGSAPELERALREAEATNPRRVVIDLRCLAFMDCTGIAIITRAQQSADAQGRRLALRSGPGQVLRLFELTGLVPRFTFLDEA